MDDNRQAYILKQEIRLLEKQKGELLRDIERIDQQHDEEYKQKQQQIKTLTDRRDELDEQIEKRRETLESLSKAFESGKESLEKLQQVFIDHAKAEAEKILEGARIVERENNQVKESLAQDRKYLNTLIREAEEKKGIDTKATT